MNKAQVVKILSNQYEIILDDKIFKCTARGKLKLDREILVGDYVELEDIKANTAVISFICPRKNQLIRPYVSNIDVAIIVIAKEPIPDYILIDKIILNCYLEGIKPIICLNKIDITTVEEQDSILKSFKGVIDTISVSSATKNGLDSLYSIIDNNLACFAGQSAVGKTSLLNSLLDRSDLKTDGLSKRIMRGKNTTRHIEIYNVGKGRVIDTCGFSMFELLNISHNDLSYYYQEFVDVQDNCRFRGCSHTVEPECAVKAAVLANKIDNDRYKRYVDIYNELKSQWSKRYE